VNENVHVIALLHTVDLFRLTRDGSEKAWQHKGKKVPGSLEVCLRNAEEL